MLIKTSEVKNDRPVYVNEITGQSGTLNELVFVPSQRRNRRHFGKSSNKVKTNRASTKGRMTYFQTIHEIIDFKKRIRDVRDENGDVIETRMIFTPITKDVRRKNRKPKVIKHIQESYDAIQRKIAVLNFYDRIEKNKIKWYEQHPEYKSRIK